MKTTTRTFAVGGCVLQDGDAGFVVGSPTGVSYKQRYAGTQSLVVAFGYNLFGDGLHFHADWILFERPIEETDWQYYVGVGARVADDEAGVRVPVGGLIELPDYGAEAFVELAPGLDFTGPGLTFDLAGGMRYHF